MNLYREMTKVILFSVAGSICAAEPMEITVNEHETRIIDGGGDYNVTIEGGPIESDEPTTLKMGSGEYSIHNKNEKAKKSWNVAGGDRIGKLNLLSPDPRGSTYTLINAENVGEINVENGNYVRISKDTTVGKIFSKEPTESNNTEIHNEGSVHNIHDIYKLENSGYGVVVGDIEIIKNARSGLLIAASTIDVQTLVNEGGITVFNDAALTIKTNDNNTGKITNYGSMLLSGVLLLQDWSSLDNYGTINSTGPYGIAISNTVAKENGDQIINNGVIRGGDYVIVLNLDGQSTLPPPGTVNIINKNEIVGGIGVLGDHGEVVAQTIVVRNEKGGRWASKFSRERKPGKESVLSKYEMITNNGSISTIKNTDDKTGMIDTKLIVNNGEIDIRQGELTINGDYQAGPGARIVTAGELGGDQTTLPTLTIHGRVNGVTTRVRVDNLGGSGAETMNGILVLRADTVDGGGFTKEGRIVAGAYDYDLVRVESGDHTEWRLTSALTPEPPGPVPPVPPGPEPGPEPVPPAPVQVVRPEAVTYAENLRQANTLFMTDIEQRRAVGEYIDPVTGRPETSSLWLSQTGGHSARHDASGQLNSDYNRYTVQLGGTMLSLPAGDDGRLEAGVQAGYGHARGNTRSGLTGYRARGTVSGYSTGLYGTWRQHRDGQSGAYISTTLQYSWLKNQVKGDDLAAEKYDARGTTLSLEGGYDYAVWQGGEQNGDSLFIRPHAQVTRMGVKADEHREANGTRVRQQGDGSVFSRTGVRVWLDKAVSKGQRVQPFVETNWLHNTRDFCSSMDGVRDC
ncbi:autotransporter outer membrane beta-barrel domain-containing protein, partial [Salmonella enterica]|nr:autotransporter outer membrane beta-barrel domain-containing protein [Salmonella enterica]